MTSSGWWTGRDIVALAGVGGAEWRSLFYPRDSAITTTAAAAAAEVRPSQSQCCCCCCPWRAISLCKYVMTVCQSMSPCVSWDGLWSAFYYAPILFSIANHPHNPHPSTPIDTSLLCAIFVLLLDFVTMRWGRWRFQLKLARDNGIEIGRFFRLEISPDYLFMQWNWMDWWLAGQTIQTDDWKNGGQWRSS